jgi:hypothetical protein
MSWAEKIFAEGSSLSLSHEKLLNADNIKARIKNSSSRHVPLEMLKLYFAYIRYSKLCTSA